MFPEIFRDDVVTFETSRLFLRWPVASDIEAIHKLAGDAEVAAMAVYIPHPLTIAEVVQTLIDARRNNAEGHHLCLAIALHKQPRQLIGMVNIIYDVEFGASLGYWLGKPYWGEGVMQEAVAALLDAFFLYTQNDEIWARVRVDNLASGFVLRRNGFDLVEQRNGRDQVEVFRLKRADWVRNRETDDAEEYAPLPLSSRVQPNENHVAAAF